MNLLRSVAMAFAMFSRIPTPKVEWKQENMRYMLAFFPLVGVVLGAVYLLWWYLCAKLGFSDLLFAAVMTALPILLTGGIHMDGFMDTVDALSSHGDIQKKRAILKDSHTGAFAVLYAALYLLVSFALFAETKQAREVLLPVCLIPVLSRAASAFASLTFPVYGEEGLLKTFRSAGSKGAVAIPLIIAMGALIAVGVLNPIFAVGLAAGTLLALLYVYRVSQKQFGGMSGDLAGFLLQICELVLLFLTIIIKAVIL